MKIWTVAREYAGIAESGGVKNVVCSLSEALVKAGHDVTCFVPFYGCTNTQCLGTFKREELFTTVLSAGEHYGVTFSTGVLNGVKIVLVGAPCFSEKQNVYTYCAADMEAFPDKKIGEGYGDTHLMNTVFQKAIFAYGTEFCSDKNYPDIIHCHDACTAALPAIIVNGAAEDGTNSAAFSKTKFIVSIHNAGPAYHHEFKDATEAAFYTGLPKNIFEKAKNGQRVEPYLLAAEYGTLSTVSPWYAEELLDKNNANTDGLSPIFAARKIKMVGITNGIDAARYTPEETEVSTLPFAFSPEKLDLQGKQKCREYFLKNIYSEFSAEGKARPSLARSGFLDEKGKVYFAYHGRLASQKGILVLLEAAQKVLEQCPEARFIINGQGEEALRNQCAEFAQKNPGRAVFFCGYEKSLSRLFTASADFAIMPSYFEPCGTEDYIAQLFGTIPVAHATGGLKKIVDGKTGFLYAPNNAETLAALLLRLAREHLQNPASFNGMIQEAARYLKSNYTWDAVALEYEKLYKEI